MSCSGYVIYALLHSACFLVPYLFLMYVFIVWVVNSAIELAGMILLQGLDSLLVINC